MEKVGRKVSSDPVQERLRLNKGNLNKQISAFISDLIDFKKLMNGWPNKFHHEKSRISDPIPADPATILGSLAGDFQEIAQKGNNIISQQMEYSKNRRKKKPKPVATEVPTVPDLAKQLAASSSSDLIAEASNPFSRLLSRIKGPWFGSGSRTRKYRVVLLKIASDLDKQLSKLESEIVKSSPESIFISAKMLDKIEDNLFFFYKTLSTYNISSQADLSDQSLEDLSSPENKEKLKDNKPLTPQEVPKTELPKAELKEITNMLLDFNRAKGNFLDLNPEAEKLLNRLTIEFHTGTPEKRKELAPIITETYNKIITDINTKRKTNAKSLTELSFAPQKAFAQLEITANNFLSKWLGKVKHQISPFDKTSAIRLDIFQEVKESREILNEIMDSLETDIKINEISLLISKLNPKIIKIRGLLRSLEITIKNKMLDKPFLNLLEGDKFNNVDLDPKQYTHLQKMLETKQLRDLVKLYSRK